MKKITLLVFIAVFSQYAGSQEIHVQQKNGLFQKEEDKKIYFHRVAKFEPSAENRAWSSITKIMIFGDRVFLLDGRQSKIAVYDINAKFLHSIGRPGQGPGDLEHPSDFFITDKEVIYVLNSMAKTIEVFTIRGEFIKRIEIKMPKELYYSYPSMLLLGDNDEIYIAYSLSPNLIDAYDENGRYLRTLLKREDDIMIPGDNIGNCSQIQFCQDKKAILHFDFFKGLFIKVNKSGDVENKFSVYDKLHDKEIRAIEDMISETRKQAASSVSIKEFQLWSRCCVDDDNNIYAFSLKKKQAERERMYVFSSKGDFLYWQDAPDRIGDLIEDAYCFGDIFIFKTQNDDLYLAKKGDE